MRRFYEERLSAFGTLIQLGRIGVDPLCETGWSEDVLACSACGFVCVSEKGSWQMLQSSMMSRLARNLTLFRSEGRDAMIAAGVGVDWSYS
jgi:hypothetical protein